MKRFAIIALLLLLFPATLPAQQTEDTAPIFRKHFSLKLFGSMARWSMTDWNDYYGRLKRMQSYDRGGGSLHGTEFHYGNDGAVEIQYSFHPQYKVGIGVGRAWGKAEMGYENELSISFNLHKYIYDDFRDESINANITPILLTFYTNTTTYPNQPYIGLGVGYYFSTFQQAQDVDDHFRHDSLNVELDEYKTIDVDDNVFISNNKMSASGIGFHAVAGTEYFITSHISFVGEIKGQYVKISSYTGTQRYTDPDTSWNRDVKCIVRTRMDETGDFKVDEFYVQPIDEPLSPAEEITQYRKGVLNFSGVALKLGFSYHF